MKKQAIVFLLLTTVFLSSAVTARAVAPSGIQARKEIRREVKQEIKTRLEEQKEALLAKLRERFPRIIAAGINRAEVTAVGDKTLTVKYDKGEVTLLITDKTRIWRKYGGQAGFSEIKKGDVVSARGDWQDPSTDSGQAILEVRVLRDLSIQKRPATFWGKIDRIDQTAKTLVLVTGNRGEMTVAGGSAKIVSRDERPLEFSDLANDHRVRVSGIWDGGTNLTEVRLIKDWSVGPVD